MLRNVILTLIGFGLFWQSADAASYGAIAYSPSTDAHGYVYNYTTRYDAESDALGYCRQYSRRNDCQVAIWFRNACGALAVGSRGWGSGWGNSRYQAENNALVSCGKHSAHCQIRRWVCSK